MAVTTRKFKPYPAYKDSGVEWLGEIPAHWEVKRLKRVFRVVNGSTPASGEPAFWDGNIPWVTPEDLGDLSGTLIYETKRNITRAGYQSCGTTLVPAGSLVLSTRAPIGHLALAGVDLCTNQGCRSLVFKRGESRAFFFYELVASRPELESLGQGSTFRELAKGMLEDVGLTEPPDPEQRAIAAFLGRETARIDALVAKKERLIDLLREQRTALITRAVTKGLDPTVPMKDSGVQWLGEIPAHWEVVRSKRLFKLRNTKSLPEDNQLTASQQYGVIPQAEFIEKEGRRVVQVVTGTDILKHVEAKDFVISMRSFQGGIEWSPYSGAISSAYVVLAPSAMVWHPYFVHLLKSKCYIQALQSTSDLVRDGQALRFENFTQVPLPSVPIEEQRAIAVFLDRETTRIDVLVRKVRDAIDRLRELRTALISAAVTGKIDVREKAA